MASATGAGAHAKPPDNVLWTACRRACALIPRSPRHSTAESGSDAANRQECSAGSTRTDAPCPQRTVSPPVTMSSCSSGTPSRRRMRALSGEATTVAPVERAMGATP
ncbi:MAG TPA: hypothetical protein VIL16_05245 [Trebonia sp.]